MYLSELSLWNFRKYSEHKTDSNQEEATGDPGLKIIFKKGLNLLVGENDSGKTAIIDSIKLLLHTHSKEYLRFTKDDFHKPSGSNEDNRTKKLKIECLFKDLSDIEASHFLEWLGIDKEKNYFLRVFLIAYRKGNSIYYDIKAGIDDTGMVLSGEARNYLRVTYLKPLRDAENELTSGRNSRLSQILHSHSAFEGKDSHQILNAVKDANQKIKDYFKGFDYAQNGKPVPNSDQDGKILIDQIDNYLNHFFGTSEQKANFQITDDSLKGILEKLSLFLKDSRAGLGSHNLLFIATELLLLQRKEYTGLKLALVEEIEAHLHPQAQLRLIEYLQELCEEDSKEQFILSSHSPILASKLKLEHLILIHSDKAFSLGNNFTKLEKGDYLFLERFLDATKSNLFFAKGVILVEGDAEAILLPTIAKIINRPLAKHGVSIVNVGSIAFLRYSKIFQRKNSEQEGEIPIPVAVLTDLDIKPQEHTNHDPSINLSKRHTEKIEYYSGQKVQAFVNKLWTLEYDIACSPLSKVFYKAVLRAKYIKGSLTLAQQSIKYKQIDTNVNTQFADWETQFKNDARKKEKIAFEIYNNEMLQTKGLKSITAQCFAELLLEQPKQEVINAFETDPYLEYITNAIKYVTS